MLLFHEERSLYWDHIGDPSTFPSSTEIVVGPGLKENIIRGYPAKGDSAVRESDYEGRDFKKSSPMMLGFIPASLGLLVISLTAASICSIV